MNEALKLGMLVHDDAIEGRLMHYGPALCKVLDAASGQLILVRTVELRRGRLPRDTTEYPAEILRLAAGNGVSPKLVARWLKEGQ